MILLIDNYDSFSYNLFQLIGEINPDIQVSRNDKITIDEIRELDPECIILSPGPGKPENAGICPGKRHSLRPCALRRAEDQLQFPLPAYI